MVVTEDDCYIVEGPRPLQPLLNISLGELIYKKLSDVSRLDQVAMVDAITSRTITYRVIQEKACLLAESLRRCGYGKGTIFSISSENSLEFFFPIISSLYIGATTAPLNHNYTETELAHCLNITKPKLIFCSKEVAPKYVNLRKDVQYNFIERILIIDSDENIAGAEPLNLFIYNLNNNKSYHYDWTKFQVENEFDPKEHTAFILCSSGTTGLPKGVMLTHTNTMVRYMHTLDHRYVLSPEQNPTIFGILPFFHGYGFITNLYALCTGQKIVVLKKFIDKVFLKTIQDYKISALWIAPPLVVFLAKSPLVPNYDLSSIKELISGAAPLSKDTEEIVKKRLNLKSIRQGYGLTEAVLAVIMSNIGDEKFGSSGKVISYMTCKVRDPETGKSLPPNQVGELCFKGPMVMKGYYGNEKATRESFTSDGWLLSGDLGYYDEEGYFYIVDRLKELIKYKAFQVAPAELEAILLTHPKIVDAGVVGLPKEDVGELPVAFVVKRPNVQITAKEVEDFVAERVSSQKRLRGGVIFVPAIPKNPSGKILRRDLKKMLTTYVSKL